MFSIDQGVWVIKRNYAERSYGMNVVEAEPFKTEELKVIGISAKAGFDGDPDYMVYNLAEQIGYKPEINDHSFTEMTTDFKEDEVFDSYDLAILSIIEMIDERAGELQEIKTTYLNILKEHKEGKQLLENELFEM